MNSAEHINQHLSAGRFFEAAGVQSFVRESGPDGGDPVLLLHGVPTSSFLWRKVLDELGERGLRGVAFDLPGLGLADRPPDYDYTWTGLGRFATAAVDALGLDAFHLVVHDIGGPVGFELIAAVGADRIKSITVLNTMIEVDTFKRPWMMEPFARRGVGEVWLRSMSLPAGPLLLNRAGGDAETAVWRAHIDLLKRGDGGRAFLQIMRGFERTRAKRDLYVATLGALTCPAQIVWGGADPALPPRPHADDLARALGADTPRRVLPNAKHFLQEDHPAEIAEAIAARAS